MVPSAEGQLRTEETCPLSALCPGLVGTAPWPAGCCRRGAGRGRERQGVMLEERGTSSGHPALLPTHSPRTFSLPSWKSGSLSVRSSAIPVPSTTSGSAPQKPGSCPAPPSSLKVPARCWWDGPGAHGRDRVALGPPRAGGEESFTHKGNSLNAALRGGGGSARKRVRAFPSWLRP